MPSFSVLCRWVVAARVLISWRNFVLLGAWGIQEDFSFLLELEVNCALLYLQTPLSPIKHFYSVVNDAQCLKLQI